MGKPDTWGTDVTLTWSLYSLSSVSKAATSSLMLGYTWAEKRCNSETGAKSPGLEKMSNDENGPVLQWWSGYVLLADASLVMNVCRSGALHS